MSFFIIVGLAVLCAGLVVHILSQKRLISALEAVDKQKRSLAEHYKQELEFERIHSNFLAAEEANVSNELALLKEELSELKSQQQSKSVRLGLLTEAVVPLHINFGVDYKTLVPMFRPIDYVSFEEDKITFIEVKMGSSHLSQKQKNIRRLVEEGKVYFKEVRVAEAGVEVK